MSSFPGRKAQQVKVGLGWNVDGINAENDIKVVRFCQLQLWNVPSNYVTDVTDVTDYSDYTKFTESPF